MIDASDIYTAKRAQNIMTEDDVSKVFEFYNEFNDYIEKVKVVTIHDVREREYSLSINNYIEKKEHEIVPPAEIRRQYFEAFDEMHDAEDIMISLLIDGGYVNE